MSFVPMDSLERIKYNIPDILPDHEAYGYSWNVWTGEDIDKPEPDMRYVGYKGCLLYTSPSPRDVEESRMPSSA